MAVGWGSDDAVYKTIESTVNDGIDFARSSISTGISEINCLDCGIKIPEQRRDIIKGCKYCINCQEYHDIKITSSINRRGSKDSQLR